MDNSDYIPKVSHDEPSVNEFDAWKNYSLLSEVLTLGGVVNSTELEPFEQALRMYLSRHIVISETTDRGGNLASEEPARALASRGSGHGSPLSKLHISPHIEYRAGASLLRANKGGISKAPKGAKRGEISGFSTDARRRLMYFIASVKRDAKLPAFITLTYPETFPDPKTSKRHLDTFFKRIRRAFPEHGTVWKLEPQERGAPHFHLMTWGCDFEGLQNFIPQAWYEIAGGGDVKHLFWHYGALGHGNVHCVQQVRKFEGVRSYAAKYLGKTFIVAGWLKQWTGRFWGVINRSNIPLGELHQVQVTEQEAIQMLRYERRFSGLNKFRTNKSLTIFCDASQWVEKLLK